MYVYEYQRTSMNIDNGQILMDWKHNANLQIRMSICENQMTTQPQKQKKTIKQMKINDKATQKTKHRAP